MFKLEFIIGYAHNNKKIFTSTTILRENLDELFQSGSYFYYFLKDQYTSMGFVESALLKERSFSLFICLEKLNVYEKNLQLNISSNSIEELCAEFSSLSNKDKLEKTIPLLDDSFKLVSPEEIDYDENKEIIVVYKSYKYKKYKKYNENLLRQANDIILKNYKMDVQKYLSVFL